MLSQKKWSRQFWKMIKNIKVSKALVFECKYDEFLFIYPYRWETFPWCFNKILLKCWVWSYWIGSKWHTSKNIKYRIKKNVKLKKNQDLNRLFEYFLLKHNVISSSNLCIHSSEINKISKIPKKFSLSNLMQV